MTRTAPPAPVLQKMGKYEECLAEAQRLYKRVKSAPAAERDAARRDYEAALQRARELGAVLARELDRAAHAA
jgi:hypothetical protein